MVTLVGRHGTHRDERTHPQVRGRGEVRVVEDAREQRMGAHGVARLEARVRLPVGRGRGIDPAAQRSEQCRRLLGRGERLLPALQPTQGLAEPGQQLAVGGPRGSFVVPDDFDWYLFIGDETALPAIGRRLEELRGGVRAIVVAAVAGPEEEQSFDSRADVETVFVHRPLSRADDPAPLLDAVRALALPDPATATPGPQANRRPPNCYAATWSTSVASTKPGSKPQAIGSAVRSASTRPITTDPPVPLRTHDRAHRSYGRQPGGGPWRSIASTSSRCLRFSRFIEIAITA